MLFNSNISWWDENSRRPAPHEGIDLRAYRNISGETISLGPDTKIPVFFTGKVVKITDDFLGRTIFVKHADVYKRKDLALYTIYGHTRPLSVIEEGVSLAEGEVIAHIAATRGSKQKVSPHLHVTAALMPDNIPSHSLNWSTVNHHNQTISLLDPLTLINNSL
ncbi:MAG: M23 family metallopeptidase [Proteobacteria bacterium]|nr:M23 family metallopeptidase [Pseudomonadota bacterium]